ncbi:alpha/beta hydrolase family protein [Alteromonas sp. a30]|uniref:alpha/beta hydrolase family protein n=1 Tax=Alteromonas sp. a30 TaxID=2730917 RepID=UPI002280DC51|nr:S9 family peptidase [Alteromonas sp. a30]MCY7294859.1 S9 family peptidase [Alteromonas sp. a30]
MLKPSWRLITAIILLTSLPVLAQISPALIAKADTYHEAELSPDGKHLAVTLTQEGERKMIVLSTSTFKMVGATAFAGGEEVGDIHWVNNERIVIKIMHKRAWLEQLQYYGELYAVNYDGSRAELIYGYRAAEKQTGSLIQKRKATIGWADIIDYMPDDEDHILISSEPQSATSDKHSFIHELNVYNGKLSKPLGRSPTPYTTFHTDQNSKVRLATSVDNEYRLHAYVFNEEERTWSELENVPIGSYFRPIAFDESGDWFYVIENHDQDKEGLFKININTGEKKKLYVDPDVDITHAVTNYDDTEVYAVRVDPGYPNYVIFNKTNEEAQIFRNLVKTFAGSKVTITSQSEDGNMSVVAVSSDTNPGIFYLYNKKTNKLSLLFNNLSHIDAKLVSLTEPVSFEARDGTKVHGLLTMPNGVAADAKVPMVTLVHGGPHGVRDYWTYNRDVQLLASQGYAVLRVNYRGSEGYGKAFWAAGHKHWGDTIQHDIIDGTKWALANHNIDASKLCIMGFSFGGYSAIQAATIEPDLFKCAIAGGGVYDLEMMFTEGDIPERGYGESYLEMALGKDEAVWRAFSPVNNVDKLKANVMIAHGEEDERVPFEHAEKLAEALKKQGKKYRWFTRSGEAHGFFDEENRTAYYEEVVDFLRENLK